jgi:hypothetical protein
LRRTASRALSVFCFFLIARPARRPTPHPLPSDPPPSQEGAHLATLYWQAGIFAWANAPNRWECAPTDGSTEGSIMFVLVAVAHEFQVGLVLVIREHPIDHNSTITAGYTFHKTCRRVTGDSARQSTMRARGPARTRSPPRSELWRLHSRSWFSPS